MKKAFKNNDIMGSAVSLACAIHCALLPILFSGSVISSHHWFASTTFEIIMISLTVLFVYRSIIKGYFQGIVTPRVLFACCTGLFLILIHHFISGYGTIVVVIGGIMIAGAHIINFFQHRHLEH